MTQTHSEQTARGEVAYLHTLHMELEQTIKELTFTAESPFGIPGRDYSEEFHVTTTPLFASLSPADNGALGEALKAVESYLDAIVCYASSIDEHEGNRVAKLVRAALRAPIERKGEG